MSNHPMSNVLNRRNFMRTGAASAFSLLCVPSVVMSSIEARADELGSDVLLRCCVMSDVHFNGSENAAEVARFRRAMQFMYEYSAQQPYANFDALVVVGDMSNHGNEAELELFKKTMDEETKPGTRTLLCMGNHEFYGGNQAFWRQKFGVEPNARYDVNGFQFIAVSPEKGTMQDGDYLYALDWFQRELDAACKEAPEKPVFVFQHYPVSPTVYGGRGHDDWGLEDLFETLQRHPQVVDFSGHTHYPINDPRCAWQGCFSAFGTGTLSYLCHGGEGGKYEKYPADSSNCGQFYVMEVRRDNSVTLKPYDLVTNSFFDVAYFVAKPGDIDSYVYTDARYTRSAKPRWSDDAEIKLLEVDEYGAFCEVPQATCPDLVHSYAFDLERFDEKTNAWEKEATQYFWSQYFQRNPPERLKLELTNLEPNSNYRALVRATNPFLRDGDQRLKVEFRTKEEPDVAPDRDAVAPSANFLNLSVVDGELRDAPKYDRKVFKADKIGNVKIEDDATLKRPVACFDGSGAGYYKIQCDGTDYRKLRRGTIAATFCADGSRKSAVGAVFGNTELRGIELSVNYAERTVNFWVSVNGRYRVLSAPIKFDEYVDVFGTYDGSVAKLYVDGKEVAREEAKGTIAHPTDPVVQAFCYGCDIAPGGKGSDFFTGKIARGRVYTWALTAEQVAALTDEER